MSKEHQISIPEIKQTHGGKREGAGRPKGTTKKEPTKPVRVPVGMLDLVKEMIGAYNGQIEPHTHDHIIALMDKAFREKLFDYDFSTSVGKDENGHRYLSDKKEEILDEITANDLFGSDVIAVEKRADELQELIDFIYKHKPEN